jgi:uncharacterized protein (TIGR02453 family)
MAVFRIGGDMPRSGRATPERFEGFADPDGRFFRALARNQRREWFAAHRQEYEQGWQSPMKALLTEVREQLDGLFRHHPLGPPKVFRIYRDVRFSKDKSPYKTNLGASFPWTGDSAADGDDATARSHTAEVHSSGGYFHLQPGEIYVGGGIWHPDKPWIDAFRRRVADDPKEFHAVVDGKAFRDAFDALSSDGHSLQRVPAGYPADHPEAETLKMKDVVFGRRLSDHEAMSPHLPDVMADSFEAAMPVFRYLASIQ